MRRMDGLAGLLVLAAASGQALGAGHDPAWSPDGETLAYYADTDGDFDIYLQTGPDAEPVKLQDDPAYEGTPRWRPRPDDEPTLSFTSDRSGRFQIYEIHADGTGEHLIADLPGTVTNHDWSHDGRLLAFEARVDGNTDIYLLDTADGRVTRLTEDPAKDFDPSFLPGSDLLVFQSNRTGRYQIHRLDRVDGPSGPITASEANATGPDWDGSQVHVIYADVAADGSRLMRFDPDDGSARPIAAFDGPALKPDISPDGSRIAYFLLDTATFDADIFVIPSDGGEPVCWTCE